jgi:hypothetical protein
MNLLIVYNNQNHIGNATKFSSSLWNSHNDLIYIVYI